MAEKEKIFSGAMKYGGIFSFKDFYKFSYGWLTEETGLDISEKTYSEKLAGNAKEITVEWACSKKITDYFKFDAVIKFEVSGLTEVEITQGGNKVKSNKGVIKTAASGILVRDYDGKFEASAFKKFLRGIYEKWVIPSRLEQMEDMISGKLNEFLEQAKAYLDLEGRK